MGACWPIPTVCCAALLLDAWNDLQVLQHALWLGRLLTAETLRQAGLTTAPHLNAVNVGLKSIPVERRRHRARDTRLLANVNGIIAAAEFGLKELDDVPSSLPREPGQRTIMTSPRTDARTKLILAALTVASFAIGRSDDDKRVEADR
ncbi:DUF1612 domain-containing protein [Sinorhizobium medicae]|uniref:DUF1612 domain-containing protein n=1 Tax=Sinorhizobium medicae TaxID=110321 RepID=UPI003988AFA3